MSHPHFLSASDSDGASAGPPLNRQRIIIAEPDPHQRERTRQMVFSMGMDIAGLAGDGQEAAQMACLLAPDFVLLDESLPVMGAEEAAFAIHTIAPDVVPIIACDRGDTNRWRELMRYGVRDVVGKPLDAAELRECLSRIQKIQDARQSPSFRAFLDPSKLPSVFCVSGGKGGVGKTMVATNLALALCADGAKTLLVDLYMQFGDVASALNMKIVRTLAELSTVTDDIDAPLVAGYVQKHSSGLDVLFGSITPLPLDSVSVACIDRLLSVVKREYKYIVFDVPPYLYATTLHALSLANAVMLVCNLFDYTTIADTKQLYETLDGAYVTHDRLKIVVNRVSTANKFHLKDVESAFGHNVFAQIPNDPQVVALLNSGYPGHEVIAQTPMGQAIAGLQEALINPAASAAEPVMTQLDRSPARVRRFLDSLKRGK